MTTELHGKARKGKEMGIQLGNVVEDRVTGFKGVVTGLVTYISGCNQALLIPKVDKDGKLVDGQWFDIQRLQLDESVERIQLENEATPGFDLSPPKR